MSAPAPTDPSLRIDLLVEMDDLHTAADLWRQVWGGDAWPVQASLLRANAHAGNYVAGAWLDGRLVGASMGFLADPDDPVLHSHITGVLAGAAGRGIGRALKDFQASWCHAHGIDLVTWTYDPLVARNAWFNLARLGVEVDEYLVDFYGDMPDERNHGQGSDRLHVTWDVTSWPADDGAGRPTGGVTDGRDVTDLVVDEDGRPRTRPAPPPDDAVLAVAVPDDIEGLRADDPALAVQWRRAVRAALADRLGTARSPGAWRIAAFTRDRRYLLVPRRPGPAT